MNLPIHKWVRVNDPEAEKVLALVLGEGAYFEERVASLSGDYVAYAADGRAWGCGQTPGQAIRDAIQLTKWRRL